MFIFNTLSEAAQESLIVDFLCANPLLKSFTNKTVIKILDYGLEVGYKMAENDQIVANAMQEVLDDEKQSLIKDK